MGQQDKRKKYIYKHFWEWCPYSTRQRRSVGPLVFTITGSRSSTLGSGLQPYHLLVTRDGLGWVMSYEHVPKLSVAVMDCLCLKRSRLCSCIYAYINRRRRSLVSPRQGTASTGPGEMFLNHANNMAHVTSTDCHQTNFCCT